MTALDAAAELVRLWPRLPGLVGPDWPRVRTRIMERVGRLRGAATDEERVEHTEALLELVLPYPQGREALADAYFRGRRSGGPEAEADWAVVSRLLDEMAYEQWIHARFDGRPPNAPLPAHVPHRLLIGVDRFAHPHAFASAQLALTVPEDAPCAVLEIDVYGDPDSVQVAPVRRSLAVWRAVPARAAAPATTEAAFDVTLLRDDRPVHLIAVVRTADGHTRQVLPMTVHPSGRFEREVPLLLPWQTASPATRVALSLVVVRGHGAPRILAWDRQGVVSAELPHGTEALDRMAADARRGVGHLLTGPHGDLYERSLDIPEEVHEANLRSVARSGLGFFNALFRDARSASPNLPKIGAMLVSALAEAGPDTDAPHIEIVCDGLHLPWHLLYAVDHWRGESVSPHRLLGIGARLTVVPEYSEHRHRTDETERPACDATALIAVNTDIDRPGTDAPRSLVSDQVDYWERRMAGRAEIVDDGDRVAAALKAPPRPDSLWYFYCHLLPGEHRSWSDATLLFAGHKQVCLRDVRLDAPDDVPLPGAPLVVLNTCASAPQHAVLRTGFAAYFLLRGARAVIGTDIEVPTELGAVWAELFFDRLLAGTPLGEALHRTARELVERHHNLLGLLYTALGSADVRLVAP